MRQLIGLLVLYVFLISCEKEVRLNVGDTNKQLVVVGHFSPESEFSIFVSETNPATAFVDPLNVPFFTNALVDISRDGQLLETLPLNSPFYQSTQIESMSGETYELSIGFPGNPRRVTAQSYIPEEVHALSAWISNVETRPIIGDEVEYLITIDVLLDNTAPGSEFLHLEFFRDSTSFEIVESDTVIQSIDIREPLNVFTTANDLPYLLHYDYGVLIRGEQINERELKYQFDLQTNINSDVEILPQIYLNVRSVSEDYYLYHSTITRQIRQSTDSVFNSPVPVFDNITNGIGIFAGYNNAIDTIPLEE